MQKRIIVTLLTLTLLITTIFAGVEAVYATSPSKTYHSAYVSGDISYYKVTAPSNGFFTVSFPDSSSDAFYYVKLTNSRKQGIFKDYEQLYEGRDFKTRIGVKKGTYYLAVKSTETYYNIKATFTKVSESSGTTRTHAKSIYKGRTKKGVITATQLTNSGDWYKIRLTRPQYVKLSISTLVGDGGTYGGFKVKIYATGSSNPGFTATFTNFFPSDTISLFTPGYSYLYPGTYYIKVQKTGSANGYYKIKWL